MLEAVTGILLATVYTPSVTGAWASVAYIQDQLTLGWFVRGLHSFGSSALIVVAGLHLLQVLLFGAYRRPRELNWMVGLALFGVVALFALSGYLLPWDQKGYWAKLVEATIAGSAPIVGGPTQKLIQGGGAFGNLTLTRAYAFHAMALPALLTGLLVLHIYLFRRHGYTPKWSLSPQDAAARAVPAWPDQAVRNAVVGALVWGVVAVAVIARHGAPLESPADPTSSYLARPEWYALPLFQLRMFFEGPLEIVATMIIPGIVTALAFALPFLDRGRDEPPVGSAAGAGRRRAGPGGADRAGGDRAREGRARSRLRQGARRGEGARRNRPAARAEGDARRRQRVPQRSDVPRARDLGRPLRRLPQPVRRGRREGPRLQGLQLARLDPRLPHRPRRAAVHGPGQDRKGDAAGRRVTPEEMDALVEYVYAETGATDVDASRAGRGRDLLSPSDCDTCHDFDGDGENDGPNLKGRGTQKWVAAVIADAGHPLLFGDRNKMPKFRGKLTPEEIDDLAKFVIGQKGK